MAWNKFVEVTRVLELQWDEYVFGFWNQLRRDPMYVKSVMSVGNSEMLSILDQLSNWKEVIVMTSLGLWSTNRIRFSVMNTITNITDKQIGLIKFIFKVYRSTTIYSIVSLSSSE